MRTCRGRNYSIFNLLPNENYIYHFRIELIGFELMRFLLCHKDVWETFNLKLLAHSPRKRDFDEIVKPRISIS